MPDPGDFTKQEAKYVITCFNCIWDLLNSETKVDYQDDYDTVLKFLEKAQQKAPNTWDK